jgi:hypothetical protein
MLKPLKVVFGVVLAVLLAGLVSQMLSEAEAFAQTVDTAWVRRYSGPGKLDDIGYAVAVDTSGNVYVTGGCKYSETNSDYTTIKYLAKGDTAWVRRYSGPGNGHDQALAIAVDDLGYVALTGFSYGSGDYVTVRYDPDGDTVWARTYNGTGDSLDGAVDVATDGSGYVYVTGQSFGSGTDYDYATIKYQPNGDTDWVRRYDGPDHTGDNAMGIAVDGSGNVCVTGFGVCWSEHPFDYVTIKYNPDGETVWVRGYNGPGDGQDRAYAIATDGSGNVYVTGESDGTGTYEDYCTIKYLSDGGTAWVRRYNGPADSTDEASDIAVDGSGNVYVTGRSYGAGTDFDYCTIKYDASGTEVWVKTYDGPASGYDNATAIAVDASGNIYVTGESGGIGSSGDYATLSYQPNGDTAWVKRYDGPGKASDVAQSIAVDDSGNVYVTGYSHGCNEMGCNDYATIKYFQIPSEVKDETGDRERPSEFNLSQNYPNPFNPTTKIEFTLTKSGFVSLEIYDVLGRKVRTLVSEKLSAGYKSVIWDGKNDAGDEVASGVYFYQLKVGDFSEPKKMLLLK